MDLIDRDALIAEYDHVHVGAPGGARKLMQDAPAVNRWIPCSERLPEVDTDVIVFYSSWRDKTIQVAHLNYDKLTFELSDGEYHFPASAVTHWMPLPEPPEKE